MLPAAGGLSSTPTFSAAESGQCCRQQIPCLAVSLQAKCEQWAAQGECTKNKEYMDDTCKKSCSVCVGNTPLEGLTPASNDLERNLAEMEKKLAASRSPSSSATDPDTANAKLVQGIGSADPDAKVCLWALPLKHGRQVQALHPERETGMPALHMQILTRSCCWARRTSRTDGVLIASINNMLSA